MGCSVLFVSVDTAISVSISASVDSIYYRFLRVCGLLISLEVEVDEESKICRQKRATEEGGVLRTGAVCQKRERVTSVCISEVLISSEIHKEEIDDKLDDLHSCEIFFPPEPSTASSRIIVIVHHDMNGKVQNDDSPRNAGPSIQLGIAKQSRGRMMENMQELERFLLQRQENGVYQFEIFEIIINHIVEFEVRRPCPLVTDCKVNSVLPCYRKDLLKHKSEKKQAPRTENDVMCLKECG